MIKMYYLSAVSLLHGFTLAAPPQLPPSQSLTLQQFNSAITNSTLALHTALPNLSLHPLPRDPTHYRVPGSQIVITFRNYTTLLDRNSAEECYVAAQGDILIHGDRMARLMSMRERDYQWGSVVFLVRSGEKMRWRDFAYTVRGLRHWLDTYGAVDLNYDVILQGTGYVGVGQLTSVL